MSWMRKQILVLLITSPSSPNEHSLFPGNVKGPTKSAPHPSLRPRKQNELDSLSTGKGIATSTAGPGDQI